MSENSVLNLSCPICKLVFKNADSIYSTSCGHIFHFACLNSWKAQSTSCPQCREYNPSTHRVYLNFDEVTESSSTPILSIQLSDTKKKVVDLEKDIENKRIQFQNLRCESEKSRKAADGRIKYLLEITNKLETENQILKNTLKGANERIKKEVETAKHLLTENSELKCEVESRGVGSSEEILRSKIKVLEQKLNLVTKQFEQEISKSTELSIERMKLQSYMDYMKSTSSPIYQEKPKVKKKSKQKTTTSLSKTIVLQKLPPDKMQFPLENVIMTLALEMHIILCKEDIKTVVNKTNPKTDVAQREITLLVEFKTEALKQDFLLGKDILKNSSTLQSLEITEYADENARQLFTYANKKLRGKVFNYIAIKSNSVVAKKNLVDSEESEIKSREHVDSLLKYA